ncbi:MAG TPA: hypothetical protein VHE81_16515, partial [Lacipirellulaceae bacterium]|nr:hypothetical protein [Lacipirellulaceae bacterium]
YVIDFWGLGYDIAEKMGLVPRIRELGYQVHEVRFVDRRGRKSGGFAVDVFGRITNGRFTSVRRSDLAATIYGALDEQVETVFGDSVAGIEDNGKFVRVSFEHAAAREVDLVIGADGLHSRVRKIAFEATSEREGGGQSPFASRTAQKGTVPGGGERFEVSLGYHVAAFEVDGYWPRDELVYLSYGVPGKQVSRFSMRNDKTLFLFVFLDKYLPEEWKSSAGGGQAHFCSADSAKMSQSPVEERRAALRHVYDGVEWECPEILTAMEGVSDIYFDRVSQIRMEHWTKGRAALVGDAAACVSLLAGEGTGLAMAEAYVLAGEIHVCGGDHAAAFARYEERMMPFLKRKQESAAKFASSFAPKTAFGIWFRNQVTRLLRIPAVSDYFIGRDLQDEIELPEYGW